MSAQRQLSTISRAATNVSVSESGATPSSSRYPGTGSPSMNPGPYWPRTTRRGSGVAIAFSTFSFSLRTESAVKSIGGSIAVSATSWSRWFWKTSRIAPACS